MLLRLRPEVDLLPLSSSETTLPGLLGFLELSGTFCCSPSPNCCSNVVPDTSAVALFPSLRPAQAVRSKLCGPLSGWLAFSRAFVAPRSSVPPRTVCLLCAGVALSVPPPSSAVAPSRFLLFASPVAPSVESSLSSASAATPVPTLCWTHRAFLLSSQLASSPSGLAAILLRALLPLRPVLDSPLSADSPVGASPQERTRPAHCFWHPVRLLLNHAERLGGDGEACPAVVFAVWSALIRPWSVSSGRADTANAVWRAWPDFDLPGNPHRPATHSVKTNGTAHSRVYTTTGVPSLEA